MAAVLQDLRDSGCVSKTIRWGVELVANVSGSQGCFHRLARLQHVNRVPPTMGLLLLNICCCLPQC
jgi:hypothetical protein